MPQWSTRWAMLAYRNGSDPSVVNSTILTPYKIDFIEYTSNTVDFSLSNVQPSVVGYSMDTVWQPRLSLGPPPDTGWERQVYISARWTHTVTYGDLPSPKGTLRLFLRTFVQAGSLPGFQLVPPPHADFQNCTYTIYFKVGIKWRAAPTTFEPNDIWESNPPLGTNVSSSFIWASGVTAKIIPKSTAFRVVAETMGPINNFGVVGSTTGPSSWQGDGAFFLESTVDLLWWYTDVSPRDRALEDNVLRMGEIYAKKSDLRNLIRSTVQQYDQTITP